MLDVSLPFDIEVPDSYSSFFLFFHVFCLKIFILGPVSLMCSRTAEMVMITPTDSPTHQANRVSVINGVIFFIFSFAIPWPQFRTPNVLPQCLPISRAFTEYCYSAALLHHHSGQTKAQSNIGGGDIRLEETGSVQW